MHIFGRDAQMQLVTRISHLERQHESLLAALPEAFQTQFHARHKQAAAEPGPGNFAFSAMQRHFCQTVLHTLLQSSSTPWDP